MKCFQRRYEKIVEKGQNLWVEVAMPAGVVEVIARGEEFQGSLFWGHWNTRFDFRTDSATGADRLVKTGLWPDWVVVEDGTRKRVRFISSDEGDRFVLFDSVAAAAAELDKVKE